MYLNLIALSGLNIGSPGFPPREKEGKEIRPRENVEKIRSQVSDRMNQTLKRMKR